MATPSAPKKAPPNATNPAARKKAAGSVAPGKRRADWEAIERDFRVGIISVREIAAAHSVSHTAINKRAKAENWVRDLKAKIQAKAEAEVSKRAVSTEVSKERQATERQVVEANAEAIVRVRLSHRQDIKRGRSIVMRLLDELELQTGPENAALLEELGVLLRKEDDKGVDKLNDLYQKVISLPGRAKTMKDLGETLRVLIGLERQAFGLDDAPEGDGGDKSFLEAMLNARARAANR